MTTKDKAKDLWGALERMKDNFNLHDLDQAISLAKDVYNEVDAMEKQMG